MHMHVYVYVYVCICICIYICMCMCIFLFLYMHVHIHIHIYIYTYVCICVYVYVCIYTHTHVHTHTWVQQASEYQDQDNCTYKRVMSHIWMSPVARVYTYIRVYTHTHTHTYINTSGSSVSRQRHDLLYMHMWFWYTRMCTCMYTFMYTCTHMHTSIQPAPMHRNHDNCRYKRVVSHIWVSHVTCVHTCMYIYIHTHKHQCNGHQCMKTKTTAASPPALPVPSLSPMLQYTCCDTPNVCAFYTHIHMNESYTYIGYSTYERVMSYIWTSHVAPIQACRDHENRIWMSKCVMSHIWFSHVTHIHESYRTCTGVSRHETAYGWVNVSCHTYDWVMSHMSTSHVTHFHESYRTCTGVSRPRQPRIWTFSFASQSTCIGKLRVHVYVHVWSYEYIYIYMYNHMNMCRYEPSLLHRNLHVFVSCTRVCVHLSVCTCVRARIIIWPYVDENLLFGHFFG